MSARGPVEVLREQLDGWLGCNDAAIIAAHAAEALCAAGLLRDHERAAKMCKFIAAYDAYHAGRADAASMHAARAALEAAS